MLFAEDAGEGEGGRALRFPLKNILGKSLSNGYIKEIKMIPQPENTFYISYVRNV